MSPHPCIPKDTRLRVLYFPIQILSLKYVQISNVPIYSRQDETRNWKIPNRLLSRRASTSFSRIVTRHTQVLHIKVGRIRRPTAPARPQHLVVNNHVKRLSDHGIAVLRRVQFPVDIKARLEGGPVVLGAQLDEDGVPGRRRGRVGVVLGRDDGARVEGVEADLAVALPLGQVDLGRPFKT